jgi:Sulfotransferase domain
MKHQRRKHSSVANVRRALRLAGRRASAPHRVLPDVYILGATKSGTRSLTYMLWQHPAHVRPMADELMYLQQLPNFRSNYENSWLFSFFWGRYQSGHATYCEAGYRKFFPTRFAMCRRQKRLGQAITSDCDPFNLYCSTALHRIQQLGGRPKFIISLREPVARAYSDYNMHRTRGGETRTFEEVIEEELNDKEVRFRKRHLNQSTYATFVQSWLQSFGKERVLILRAEDLFADATAVARQMFEFLELPSASVIGTPRNVGSYESAIPSEVVERLAAYFHPHNERLYELIGRRLWPE